MDPTRSHPPPRRQRHRFEIPKGETAPPLLPAPSSNPARPFGPFRSRSLRSLQAPSLSCDATGPASKSQKGEPCAPRQRASPPLPPARSTLGQAHRCLPFGHLRHVLRPLRTAARFRHWPRFEKANRAHPASGPPRLPSSGPAGLPAPSATLSRLPVRHVCGSALQHLGWRYQFARLISAPKLPRSARG